MNSQDLLWGVVGSTWWTGYAIICGFAAILWFRFTARSPQRDALTVARLIVLGGFVTGAFVPLNSACQPLSAALLATGGAFASILLTTDWCRRRGSTSDKVKAIVREAIWGPQRLPPLR